MSLMASLVTTSRTQQCFNVLIDICHEFLLLFYCCVRLKMKLTTTSIGASGWHLSVNIDWLTIVPFILISGSPHTGREKRQNGRAADAQGRQCLTQVRGCLTVERSQFSLRHAQRRTYVCYKPFSLTYRKTSCKSHSFYTNNTWILEFLARFSEPRQIGIPLWVAWLGFVFLLINGYGVKSTLPYLERFIATYRWLIGKLLYGSSCLATLTASLDIVP